MPSIPAAPLLRFTCANAFLRLSRSTITSINGPKAAWLSTLVFAVRASVPSMPELRASPVATACKVISSSVFCRIARPRSPFYLPFHRSGLHRVAPPTTPSADFCAAVRPPCGSLSLVAETQHRSPEVRSTAFAARPSDLPPRPLMAVDFAIGCSLVRPGRPRYPLLVYRAAALLHASFRPRLATTPLRFANPSPPSGWIEDFHLQAVDHARHTAGTPSQGDGVAGPVVQAWPDFQDLLGGGRRRPGRERGRDRHAARPPQCRARLVAKARSRRPDRGHQLESPGARRWPELARAGTGHRPHPSIARSLRRHGLADCRRQYLWQRTALRRAEPASAFPRDRDPDFEEQGPGARGGRCAGPFARTAHRLRVEWGVASRESAARPRINCYRHHPRKRVAQYSRA